MNYFFTTTDFKDPGNRTEIIKGMGLDNLRFIGANQTHSVNIAIVDANSPSVIDNTDALITDCPGIAIYILTADCVPVLLHDSKKNIIAAIHAGWRGTANQIVSKTITTMIDKYRSNPCDIQAVIGPHIHSCCYEVGLEVAQAIGEKYIETYSTNERPMISLFKANKAQLLEMGIDENNITTDTRCTCCNNLPSCRRFKTLDRIGSCIYL